MRVVGIDSHKATLAACAIDEVGQPIAEATFANEPAGFTALLAWLAGLGQIERIGLEGSAGYGAAAARHLLGRAAPALEVPPQLSHRERLRSRRAGKSDPGDALAIARVTLRESDLPPVRLPDASRELGLLVEAREDLVAEGTRVRNRLHADLVVLVPGYGTAAANLVAAKHRRTAGRLLRGLPGIHAELARGVAPIPASSGQVQRMRLNRGGNRQLNRALYSIAFAPRSGRTSPRAPSSLASGPRARAGARRCAR
jgi:transposase